jgi:hypothetical protein
MRSPAAAAGGRARDLEAFFSSMTLGLYSQKAVVFQPSDQTNLFF